MAASRIPLSDLIAELRRELAMAQATGESSGLKLLVEEAEVELQVVVTHEENGGLGVKFWVLNADIKDRASDAATQRVKLKLIPTDANGKPLKIRARE
jgi:hypothetical protein